VAEAVDIGASPFALEPVSATFHGRDIFAPVAARLAGGATLADAGVRIDADALVALELPRAEVVDGVMVAHVTYVDRFGNVQLDAEEPGFEPGREFELAGVRARYLRTFADAGAGEVMLYEDSSRRLAVAVNQGDAAVRLGLAVGDELRIRLR